jgi:hypothetical protein
MIAPLPFGRENDSSGELPLATQDMFSAEVFDKRT